MPGMRGAPGSGDRRRVADPTSIHPPPRRCGTRAGEHCWGCSSPPPARRVPPGSPWLCTSPSVPQPHRRQQGGVISPLPGHRTRNRAPVTLRGAQPAPRQSPSAFLQQPGGGGDWHHLPTKFHSGLKHSNKQLVVGLGHHGGLSEHHPPASGPPPTGRMCIHRGTPLEKRQIYLLAPVSLLCLRAALLPQHTPEDTGGQRHPAFKHPTRKAAPEPLQPREEQFWGAGGCRGRVPAPTEPPPSLHRSWPLISQGCPEIRWEVSVNQLQTIKSLAKPLSCYFCEELGLYKIKQHES